MTRLLWLCHLRSSLATICSKTNCAHDCQLPHFLQIDVPLFSPGAPATCLIQFFRPAMHIYMYSGIGGTSSQGNACTGCVCGGMAGSVKCAVQRACSFVHLETRSLKGGGGFAGFGRRLGLRAAELSPQIDLWQTNDDHH